MHNISYAQYRFPPVIIQHAVWLYFRFPLSYRDVEDLLAERGIDVSYETVRRWALKFGQAYARRLRTTRPRPDARWHLDEVFVSIDSVPQIHSLGVVASRRRCRARALRRSGLPARENGAPAFFAPPVSVENRQRIVGTIPRKS